MDRVVYVVSDLHLGPGWLPSGDLERLEDFTADDDFAHFLQTIGTTGTPVELVIAGDFLEYCQTLPRIGLASPEDHLGSSEAESVERTRVILGLDPQISSGHPRVFAALRRFMMEGNSVTIIAGNHDIDLLWDRVWALVFDAIYPPGAWGDLRLVEYSMGTSMTPPTVLATRCGTHSPGTATARGGSSAAGARCSLTRSTTSSSATAGSSTM